MKTEFIFEKYVHGLITHKTKAQGKISSKDHNPVYNLLQNPKQS